MYDYQPPPRDNWQHKAIKDDRGYKLYVRWNNEWHFCGRYYSQQELLERAENVEIVSWL